MPDFAMDNGFVPSLEQHLDSFAPDFDLNRFLFTPELPQMQHRPQTQNPLRYSPPQADPYTNSSGLGGSNRTEGATRIPQQGQPAGETMDDTWLFAR